MAIRGGIDLGGTKIQAVVVGDGADVMGSSRLPTPRSGGPADVAADDGRRHPRGGRAGGGRNRGSRGRGRRLPRRGCGRQGHRGERAQPSDWEEPYPLRDELASRLDTKVRLGNDVQVATDAEFALGAGRDFNSILGVFWGTGVGGGIVLDGKPWLGRSAAGEIGHVVVRMGGRKCSCGRRGCMEAYAGRLAMELHARELLEKGEHTRLFEIMEERGRERLTSGVWARALKADDEVAEKIIRQAIKALGAGIASAQNLLDVEAVVIGGGMGIRLGEPYADRIREAMMPHLFVDSDPPAVHVAALGDLGGAIGASLLVRQNASDK